jgi:RimJ/RimL family protein N-acetyltransferase
MLGDAATERLLLEPWNHATHGDPFAVLNADPAVSEHGGGGGAMTRAGSDELSLRIESHWQRFGFGLWAAVVKDSGAMIGFVGICHPLWWPEMSDRVEVGWRLAREAWGHGYATEGGAEALRAGFQVLRLREIVAFVHPDNARSLAVAARLGMTEEAELPHPFRDHPVKVLQIACSTS